MGLTSIKVPGKVMLSGEYAVLYGGTATLVPVPLYLEADELESSPPKQYSPVVEAGLGLDIPEIREYELKNGKPHVTIDNTMLFGKDDTGKLIKLGLGSSAAEAVAVVKLRLKRAQSDKADDLAFVLDYAYRIHDKVQGGAGSGADVAACTFAKPIIFISKYDPESKGLIRSATSIQTSYKYPMNLLWTGVPADTRVMIAKFGRWVENSGKSAQALLSEMTDISDELANLWFNVELDVIFDKLDEFSELMENCAIDADLNYLLPIHERIENWAIANGGRAKPTGAGGGDMILLIGELPLNELHELIIPMDI